MEVQTIPFGGLYTEMFEALSALRSHDTPRAFISELVQRVVAFPCRVYLPPLYIASSTKASVDMQLTVFEMWLHARIFHA
jgi:hypothetical protein